MAQGIRETDLWISLAFIHSPWERLRGDWKSHSPVCSPFVSAPFEVGSCTIWKHKEYNSSQPGYVYTAAGASFLAKTDEFMLVGLKLAC